MATSELKQILNAPADAVLVCDTNGMELEEVASALGISRLSDQIFIAEGEPSNEPLRAGPLSPLAAQVSSLRSLQIILEG